MMACVVGTRQIIVHVGVILQMTLGQALFDGGLPFLQPLQGGIKLIFGGILYAQLGGKCVVGPIGPR